MAPTLPGLTPSVHGLQRNDHAHVQHLYQMEYTVCFFFTIMNTFRTLELQ